MVCYVCGTVCVHSIRVLYDFISNFWLNLIFVHHSFSEQLKIGSIFTTCTQLTLTGRGVSRVNYEVPRLSKLHEDGRRCSKDFQQVWYKLELFKVCHDDMPCEVKQNTHECSWGVEKVGKIH